MSQVEQSSLRELPKTPLELANFYIAQGKPFQTRDVLKLTNLPPKTKLELIARAHDQAAENDERLAQLFHDQNLRKEVHYYSMEASAERRGSRDCRAFIDRINSGEEDPILERDVKNRLDGF